MAPPRKKAKAVATKQSSLLSFGTITKSAASQANAKGQVKTVAPSTPASTKPIRAGSKRALEEEDPNDSDDTYHTCLDTLPEAPKPRIPHQNADTSSQASESDTEDPASSRVTYTSASSPISSQDEPEFAKPITRDDLPRPLKEILVLHHAFLKALSIHFAQVGPSAPAELGSLMKTMTSLYKKHTVKKEDIQRMLALYEFFDQSVWIAPPRPTLPQRASPFQLRSMGTAACDCTVVVYIGSEYVDVAPGDGSGFSHIPFHEKTLRTLFEVELIMIYREAQHNTYLNFLNGPITGFPQLLCNLGTVSTLFRQKVMYRRKDILGLTKKKQDVNHVTHTACDQSPNALLTANSIFAVGSRTASLFDRLSSKRNLASSSTAPTALQLTHRRAVGRIAEVVDILRIKQQQKVCSTRAVTCTSSGRVKLGKVSFSMSQLINDIRDSVGTPIAIDEIRECLRILDENTHDTGNGKWLTVVKSEVADSKAEFIVLEGTCAMGQKFQKTLEEHEKMIA